MTNPASDIAKYLVTATATAAACSGRVYWPYATSEPTLPYACVRLVSWRRPAVDMREAREPKDVEVEVLTFGASQESAWTLADAVISDLDNHTGLTPSGGGSLLRHCYCSGAVDVIEAGLFDRGIFSVALTFSIKL